MKSFRANPVLARFSPILTVALVLQAIQNAPAATEHWIGNPGVTASTNWSDSANWSSPQQTFFNQVQFLGAGAVGAPGVINSVVDSTTGPAQMPIWQFDITPTNANYTFLIAP